MPSRTDIANLALQKLGAKRIAALSDASASARAANFCFDMVYKAELRKFDWNFSIVRAELAADAPAPTWGRSYSYTLPSDFLKLSYGYAEISSSPNNNTISFGQSNGSASVNDFVIENGNKIYTDIAAPLRIRYVADITDTTEWDSLFVQVVATAIAITICEEITQSNTKKAALIQEYKDFINEAKHADSIEVAPAESPIDTYVTIRN